MKRTYQMNLNEKPIDILSRSFGIQYNMAIYLNVRKTIDYQVMLIKALLKAGRASPVILQNNILMNRFRKRTELSQ